MMEKSGDIIFTVDLGSGKSSVSEAMKTKFGWDLNSASL